MNWTAQGEAFDFQPTKGDNVAVRYAQPKWEGKFYAGLQGNYYVSTLEKYDGSGETPPGTRRTGSEDTGVLRSVPFRIAFDRIHFLANGGVNPDITYVALEVDGEEVRITPGTRKTPLRQESWDVSEFIGRSARVVVKDLETAPGGNVQVDYFRYIVDPGANPQ